MRTVAEKWTSGSATSSGGGDNTETGGVYEPDRKQADDRLEDNSSCFIPRLSHGPTSRLPRGHERESARSRTKPARLQATNTRTARRTTTKRENPSIRIRPPLEEVALFAALLCLAL